MLIFFQRHERQYLLHSIYMYTSPTPPSPSTSPINHELSINMILTKDQTQQPPSSPSSTSSSTSSAAIQPNRPAHYLRCKQPASCCRVSLHSCMLWARYPFTQVTCASSPLPPAAAVVVVKEAANGKKARIINYYH